MEEKSRNLVYDKGIILLAEKKTSKSDVETNVINHMDPEFTQTHVHRLSDAIQPSHPLLFPSLLAFNLSQYQGLFQ